MRSLVEKWRDAWPRALAIWSPYVQLQPPILCENASQEHEWGLHESFAMIRLVDHRVVIGLRQVQQHGLQDFALEILAHEIGHHVYVPADLQDNARQLARTTAGLAGRRDFAPMVANLWSDLLINDRLQRHQDLDMAGVYRKLISPDEPSNLWKLYLRTYELLWNLPRGDLFEGLLPPQVAQDAALAMRLVRSYSQQWLSGAGRFAALVLPYIMDHEESLDPSTLPWFDAITAGRGSGVPDGLATIDIGELEETRHPAFDERLGAVDVTPDAKATGAATKGGVKNRYRPPREFRELMRSAGVQLSEQAMLRRYYSELARPYLIPFPTRSSRTAGHAVPAGIELWEPGSPVYRIDWMASMIRSPVVIPGVTTVEPIYDETPDDETAQEPPDLYLGVDCSGSMANPADSVSYPVIAGTVVTLSALRAGARVKTVLSGEPGRYAESKEFSSSAEKNLNVLTHYLGTGYAFGMARLLDEFLFKEPPKHPVHVLILTDTDIFSMLREGFEGYGSDLIEGWEIARRLPDIVRGGVSLVLDGGPAFYKDEAARLEEYGWTLHSVQDEQSLLQFARAFSRTEFER